MIFRYLTLYSLCLLIVLACSTSPDKDPVLIEANKLHENSMQLHDSVIATIKNLQEIKAQWAEDSSSTAEYEAFAQSLSELEADFATWDENLVGVPGFEAEHHHHHEEGEHDHDHDHDHASEDLADLPPDQILAIQQEILNGISDLHLRSQQLAKDAASIQ